MQLVGDHFCAWTDEQRELRSSAQGFSDVASGFAAIADVDDDGNDDIVLAPPGGPEVWRGNGAGSYAPIGFAPMPDAPAANFLLFGDVDNDGDEDAFASQYVQTDADGDGADWDVDCDNGDPAVKPGALEAMNSKDDDCDGVADDQTSAADQDGDGVSIAAGDCDDTQSEARPGAPELLNERDEDCDGQSDEDFPPKILLNDGFGHFTHAPSAAVEFVGPSSAAAFGDGNGDGKLDLYAGYWLEHYPSFPAVPSRYYQAEAGGGFVEVGAAVGIVQTVWRPVYGVLWTDWNDDGLADIYVSNYQLAANLLWKNLGAGKFAEVAASVNAAHDDIVSSMIGYPGGHSFGSDVGDIDNDGDLDLFVPNIAHPRVQPSSDPSMLLVNQGAPDYAFSNRRRELGIAYDEGDVNSAFGDYDNDGDLDLYVASTYESHYGRLYENDGQLGFVDVSYETGAAIHSAQTALWLDADRDGDLDLLITSPGPGPRVLLLVNQVGQKNHSVLLELEGTTANKSAIGARVRLTAAGVTQTREVTSISSHQSTRAVHFGIGSASAIDEVVVRWPDGTTESISGVAADGRFRILQGSGTAQPR